MAIDDGGFCERPREPPSRKSVRSVIRLAQKKRAAEAAPSLGRKRPHGQPRKRPAVARDHVKPSARPLQPLSFEIPSLANRAAHSHYGWPPVESTLMIYPGDRIMEMLSRGISTRRPTLNSVFLITLGFQFFRVSAVGCNASVIALTVAPARQQRSCDHR